MDQKTYTGGYNRDKLNPIKWTQQKPIWDVFWKPVSYCGHSKN